MDVMFPTWQLPYLAAVSEIPLGEFTRTPWRCGKSHSCTIGGTVQSFGTNGGKAGD